MTNVTDSDSGQRGMRRWKSHKVVEAGKIDRVEKSTGDAWHLTLDNDGDGGFVVVVSSAYISKHGPLPGGYYVRYKDGYESYSPAEAFEDGYTLIDDSLERPQYEVVFVTTATATSPKERILMRLAKPPWIPRVGETVRAEGMVFAVGRVEHRRDEAERIETRVYMAIDQRATGLKA